MPPVNVKVIQAGEFIRASPLGQVQMDKAEALLKEIADASAGLEEFQVLVDTRRTPGSLAIYRRTIGNRTAILCPFERFDQARFFALCAENQGFNVQAFTSYEDAMEWLITS